MFVEQEYFIGYRDVNINEELTNTGLLAFLENNAGKHSSLVGNKYESQPLKALLKDLNLMIL